MNLRRVRAILILAISLVSAGLAIVDSPLTSVIPNANAAVPGSKALLGFFNEAPTVKSSAVVSSSLGVGSFVKFDINVTGAGPIKGVIIQFNWTSTALAYTNSSYGNYVGFHYRSNTMCPASQGCIFDGFPSGAISVLGNSTSAGGYYLALLDTCTTACNPTVVGTGILFRVVFRVLATSQHTVIKFENTVTTIENPGPVPYESMDGYFDNTASPLLNYVMGVNVASTNVIRPVSQFQTNSTQSVSVSISSFVCGAGGCSVKFGTLGLPQNAVPTFGTPTCTAACSSTLQISVKGGGAGAPGTTPSGNYTIAVVSNATAPSSVAGMVKETWLLLIVRPPKPPVLTLTASTSTTFNQEAGKSNAFTLTTTLVTGANDSLAESTTCLNVQLVCTLTPPGGVFASGTPPTFVSGLNASSSPNVPTGVYRFNASATTAGTYSEVSVTVVLVFTINITRTHDLSVTQASMPKLFSYEGVSLIRPSGHPINMTATVTNLGASTESFTVNATAKAKLQNEAPNNLTYVDSNSNGVWDSGLLSNDPRIKFIDTNGNGVWNALTVTGDPLIKFVDKNANGHWDPGENVTYDANNNNLYDTGEPVIACYGTVSGCTPTSGTALASDSKLKFVDLNSNAHWDPGEPVIYDSNANGVWDSGFEVVIAGKPIIPEPVVYDNIGNGIYGAADTVILGNRTLISVGTILKTDAKLKFEDQNGNGLWDTSEIVAYDSNGDGMYQSMEIGVAGPPPLREVAIRDTDGSGTYTAGDVVLPGFATPPLGTRLNHDNNIRFVDTNFNNKWDSGETVIYDSNGDTVYERSDPVVSGAAPSLGVLVGTGCVGTGCTSNPQPLQAAEPIVGGVVANNTALITDSKIKYLNLNSGTVFSGGQESVVYDSNNNGVYNPSDPNIRFVDTNFDGVWTCTTSSGTTCTAGESVVYDSNSNGKYDSGEPVLFGSTPAVGKSLNTDSKIRFVDTNNNGHWDAGEPVVYDANNNGLYNTGELVLQGTTPAANAALKGEPVIAGLAPLSGASLSTDTKLKFADANGNGVWDNGEAVVYDLNGDGKYFNGARSIIINIDPENAPHGNYVIFTYAIPVTGEISLSNNGLGIVSFTQKLRGDITGDCKVNIFDLTSVGGIFGATMGSAGYNVAADLNNDGIINIFDLSLVGGNFGASC